MDWLNDYKSILQWIDLMGVHGWLFVKNSWVCILQIKICRVSTCHEVSLHLTATQATAGSWTPAKSKKKLTAKFYYVRLFKASNSWCILCDMSKYSSVALKTLYSQCDLQPTFPACHPLLPDTNSVLWPK